MIEIVEYDPQWPKAFCELKGALAGALGDLALAIEHVGSTAVPALAGKPIIDIDVVIGSRKLLEKVIAALALAGYQHQGDKGIPGREAFGRRGSDVPMDGTGRLWPPHHLYVCDKDNPELHRQLAFRDFLRCHPEYVQRYAQLKRALSRQHAGNRDAYTDGKTAFVSEVMLAASTDKHQ